MEELDNILNNWNISSLEKGNKCFDLAKTFQHEPSKQLDLLKKAVCYYEYEKTSDISRLCNLAHCYFLLARIFNIQQEEFYRKSIEYHIKGSKNNKYQYENFYKFYDVDENSIDSVLRTIRLSKPSTFNDPTDSPISQEGLSNDIFPSKTVFDGLRVCCFGHVKGRYRAWEDSKNWAYYGNNHKGICICYRFSNNILEDYFPDKFVFNKIDYKKDFDFNRGIVADGFLRKSKSYEMEKEWRIVFYDRDYIHSDLYLSKDENIYLPIGKENIYQIFIGYRCPDSIRKTVENYAKEGNPKIQVYRIIPDTNNVFKLTSVIIDL